MKILLQSIRQTIVWTIVCGIIYPIVITLIAKVAFTEKAEGSLVMKNGQLVGSAFLTQQFTGTNYFWPRPSACTYGSVPTNASNPSGLVPSSASNLGPTSGALQTNVINNIGAFISGNNLPTNTGVPADMAFASASGLDPHISPEAAQLQIARVAASRGLSADTVRKLVDTYTEAPQWGFLGQSRVNVLLLNVALDRTDTKKVTPAAAPKT
jgi:potassium-transporting ATPase KdpC subunit